MQFTPERYNSDTYLICRFDPEEIPDQVALSMITNNTIDGLLPASSMQRNMERYVQYDITSKVPLNDIITRVMRKKNVLRLLGSMADVISDAGAYMLNQEGFLLDIEHIYVDTHSMQVLMVYLPVTGFRNSHTPVEFLKELLFRMRYDCTENTSYVAEMITAMNAPGHEFNFSDLKTVLDRMKQEDARKGDASGA